WYEREGANLTRDVLIQKATLVAAGLGTHGDNGVGTALLQPPRFRDCCCRRDYLRAGRLNPRDEGVFRQPEVETHHGGLVGLDQPARGTIKGSRIERRSGLLYSVLGIVDRQLVAPAPDCRLARCRRNVAEEIQTDRSIGGGTDGLDLTCRLLWRHQGARKRPKTSGAAYLYSHARGSCARHRRLNDGQIYIKQIKNASIRPGRTTPRICRAACTHASPLRPFGVGS